MKLAHVVLAASIALFAGCTTGTPSDPEPSSPTSWLAMEPGAARAFDGPGGEVVLIYVDETYDFTGVAGAYASAVTWKRGDRYTTDYWVQDDDGTLWWYGRKGAWRAGRNGERPREIPLGGGEARFGDRVIVLSDDGPTELETPDGRYTAAG